MDKCDSYHIQKKRRYTYNSITGEPIGHDIDVGVCWGTKETDECSCGGDRIKCDFYPEIRNKALKERESKSGEWISVEDRLPKNIDDVLCWYEYRAMDGTHEGEMVKRYGIGYYFNQSKTWGGEVSCGCNTGVIAWMPLPPPPSDKEER